MAEKKDNTDKAEPIVSLGNKTEDTQNSKN